MKNRGRIVFVAVLLIFGTGLDWCGNCTDGRDCQDTAECARVCEIATGKCVCLQSQAAKDPPDFGASSKP